jgi:hypothetical protein
LFFDDLELELGVKQKDDWYRVTYEDMKENGAGGVLSKYQDSLFAALKAIYPDFKWQAQNFTHTTKGYWDDISHQRAFFERLARTLKVKSADDWYDVKGSEVMKRGGSGILSKYDNSLYTALKSIYPEYQLQPWRFNITPKGFWEHSALDNQKAFLDDLKKQRGIKTPTDWSRISHAEIIRNGGGALLKLHGSLTNALEKVYLQKMPITMKHISKAQQQLFHILQCLHISKDLQMNYKCTTLFHKPSNRAIEFDFYYPSLKLAIEYQGYQHYNQTFRGNFQQQSKRDEEKREACKSEQITLLEIPYSTWDGKAATLVKMIKKQRPDIVIHQGTQEVLPLTT